MQERFFRVLMCWRSMVVLTMVFAFHVVVVVVETT